MRSVNVTPSACTVRPRRASRSAVIWCALRAGSAARPCGAPFGSVACGETSQAGAPFGLSARPAAKTSSGCALRAVGSPAAGDLILGKQGPTSAATSRRRSARRCSRCRCSSRSRTPCPRCRSSRRGAAVATGSPSSARPGSTRSPVGYRRRATRSSRGRSDRCTCSARFARVRADRASARGLRPLVLQGGIGRGAAGPIGPAAARLRHLRGREDSAGARQDRVAPQVGVLPELASERPGARRADRGRRARGAVRALTVGSAAPGDGQDHQGHKASR